MSGCFWSMKFIRGTCWILPSCSCALVEAESNSKERHAVQNRSLVCRVTYIFLGNETNISSEQSLTIFGKVTYTCLSANFVFYQRARCNRTYAFTCFSSQNYWAVSKVCGKALMSVFFIYICTIISPFSCLFLCSNESKTHNPGKQEDPIKKRGVCLFSVPNHTTVWQFHKFWKARFQRWAQYSDFQTPCVINIPKSSLELKPTQFSSKFTDYIWEWNQNNKFFKKQNLSIDSFLK